MLLTIPPKMMLLELSGHSIGQISKSRQKILAMVAKREILVRGLRNQMIGFRLILHLRNMLGMWKCS